MCWIQSSIAISPAYAKPVPVEDAEAATGQTLPDLLAAKGVEMVTRKWPDGRSETALRVPLRLIARVDMEPDATTSC